MQKHSATQQVRFFNSNRIVGKIKHWSKYKTFENKSITKQKTLNTKQMNREQNF